MLTDATTHGGHTHEAGFYSSDAQFRALIVPFVEESFAAGEPVIIGYDERKSNLLRSWIGEPSTVTFIGDTSLYATPARAIATYGRLFERHVAAGAKQIRIAGDVPHAGNGGRFDGWDRYESAINTVWDDFPVQSLCLYDATTVTPRVRDVVERTHAFLRTPSGQRLANARYDSNFMSAGPSAAVDPLESTAPTVELDNAAPNEARDALERVARGRVDDHTLGDLLIAISEVTTNAREYGRAPTSVIIWVGHERVVIHVSDSGPGPTDRHAGLVPATPGAKGLGMGLWLTHQLDIDVALIRTPESFTVRLRGGKLAPSAD